MSEKNIIVVGGGFASIRLIRALRKGAGAVKIQLVDPREKAVFLPLLPDVVAGKVKADRLLFPLSEFCRRHGAAYLPRAAVGLKDDRSLILDDGRELPFDIMALCCGATPNFYGDDRAARIAFTLYGVKDARKLARRVDAVLEAGKPHVFVVAGGGYTGVEAVTAIVYRIRKHLSGKDARNFTVRMVEIAPRILAGLPESIARPAREEVQRLGIVISTASKITALTDDRLELEGDKITNYTLIWSAGVRTVDFVHNLPYPKDRQGRLSVNADLRLTRSENIYALGDCASFSSGKGTLRPAVQFSWAQGLVAGENIIRQLNGKPTLPYRPRDLGYLIPLSSGKAWGEVLGIKVGGRIGSFLHYFMCVWRTLSFSNRLGIIRDLLRWNGGIME